MYREVLPLLDNFVSNNSKNGDKQKFIDMFPNFFGSGEVNGDLILVFEDILDGEKTVSYMERVIDVWYLGTDWFVTEKNVKCKEELFHSREQILVTLENLAR